MAKDKEKNKEEKEETEKKSGGSKLLLIIIIVLLLILLIIGGLVAYFLLTGGTKKSSTQSQTVQNKKVSALTQIGPIYPLDPFIVNLVSPNADRYLKCKIDLQLSSAAVQKEIDKRLPAIRDLIIQILSSKTVAEIQTIKGKQKLKEEIKNKINQLLPKGEVTNVYFTQFIIQ